MAVGVVSSGACSRESLAFCAFGGCHHVPPHPARKAAPDHRRLEIVVGLGLSYYARACVRAGGGSYSVPASLPPLLRDVPSQSGCPSAAVLSTLHGRARGRVRAKLRGIEETEDPDPPGCLRGVGVPFRHDLSMAVTSPIAG
jgi:hypothetical protein